MKMEIAKDYNLNLIEQYENLTQCKQSVVLFRGKKKECSFKFNGRKDKADKKNRNLGVYSDGVTKNPFLTKTYYIRGCYKEKNYKKPQLEIKIYNKSDEVREVSRDKIYILDYFNRSATVYRCEVAYNRSAIIKETLQRVFGLVPFYIHIVTDKEALERMFTDASQRLFCTNVKSNHKTYSYEFTELVDEDMIIR